MVVMSCSEEKQGAPRFCAQGLTEDSTGLIAIHEHDRTWQQLEIRLALGGMRDIAQH